MHFSTFALFAASVVLQIDLTSAGNGGEDPQVRTSSGLVTGHSAPNVTGVWEFLGIPYAQPPVGDLRFAPPKAVNSSYTALTASDWVRTLSLPSTLCNPSPVSAGMKPEIRHANDPASTLGPVSLLKHLLHSPRIYPS